MTICPGLVLGPPVSSRSDSESIRLVTRMVRAGGERAVVVWAPGLGGDLGLRTCCGVLGALGVLGVAAHCCMMQKRRGHCHACT